MTNIRYVSVFLSFCFSVFLSFCLSVFLSFCLSVSMSLCLSVFFALFINQDQFWDSLPVFCSRFLSSNQNIQLCHATRNCFDYFETVGGRKAYWCGPNIRSQPAILAYISRGQDTSSKGLLCKHCTLSHGNNLISKTLTVPVRWRQGPF